MKLNNKQRHFSNRLAAGLESMRRNGGHNDEIKSVRVYYWKMQKD